jgi:hypothetical protein
MGARKSKKGTHFACLGARIGQVKEATRGGWGRNRTDVHGFAGRCIATLPPSRELVRDRRRPSAWRNRLERETRLELATPTLARLCSTN